MNENVLAMHRLNIGMTKMRCSPSVDAGDASAVSTEEGPYGHDPGHPGHQLDPESPMRASPLLIIAAMAAMGDSVGTLTHNKHSLTQRDPKGVVHAFRVASPKFTKHSMMEDFFWNDAQRQRLATKSDGELFRALRGRMPDKRVKAAKVGLATATVGGMLAMGMGGQWEPIRQTIMQDLKAQGGDVISELKPGSVYESRDNQGNWWPIKVDADNGDGSYKSTVIVRGASFEDPVWPNVYAQNCRYVTQISLVQEEFIPGIAAKPPRT